MVRPILKLGKEIIKVSSIQRWKYQFRKLWLENLIRRYKKFPGTPIIHLNNLPDSIRIGLDERGKEELKRLHKETIKKFGYYKTTQYMGKHIRYIYKYLNNEMISLPIVSLKNLTRIVGVDINIFEPYVLSLQIKGSKFLKIKQFPIRLDNKYGCVLVGLFPDASYRGYGTSFKDKYLVEQIIDAITNIFGNVKPSGCGTMYFTSAIPHLLTATGIDTTSEQIKANNPAPLWLFSLPLDILKHYLRSVWDAEGGVNITAKSLYLVQAVILDLMNLECNKRTSFGKLHEKIKNDVLNYPPLLLLSNLLLLKSIGIESRLHPNAVYKRKKDEQLVAIWNLEIYGYENLYKFYKLIGFGLPQKNEKLQTILNSYKRRIRAKGQGYYIVLQKAVRLKEFTKIDLVKATQRSINTINHFIKLMKRAGHLRLHHKNGRIAIYSVTEKGAKYYAKLKYVYD